MDAGAGLHRIALVVWWLAAAIGLILILVVPAAMYVMEANDAVAGTVASVIAGGIVLTAGKALSWIIDGFAGGRDR